MDRLSEIRQAIVQGLTTTGRDREIRAAGEKAAIWAGDLSGCTSGTPSQD